MEHDACRNTARYKTAGQNLAIFWSKPNAKPIKEAIQQAIQNWYDEYKDVPSLQEVEKLGSTRPKKPIGHWTQVVQSKAHRIGCSVVQFTNNKGWQTVLVGCNYRLLSLLPIYHMYMVAINYCITESITVPVICGLIRYSVLAHQPVYAKQVNIPNTQDFVV